MTLPRPLPARVARLRAGTAALAFLAAPAFAQSAPAPSPVHPGPATTLPPVPAAAAPLPVPAGGRALTPEETDAAVDRIFANARNIQHIETALTTVTYDTDQPQAAPRARKVSYGLLRLSVPNLMFIQDFELDERGAPRPRPSRRPEDSSYMIIDGQSYMEISAVPANAPRNARPAGKREAVPATVRDGHAGNIAAVLGMFLGLDRPVMNARELRADFQVDGVVGPFEGPQGTQGGAAVQHHFRLKPLRSGSGMEIELWHVPDTALPWRAKIVERKLVFDITAVNQDRYVYAHTERRLTSLRTNLDRDWRGFPRDAFRVPGGLRVAWDGQ